MQTLTTLDATRTGRVIVRIGRVVLIMSMRAATGHCVRLFPALVPYVLIRFS